MPMAGRGTRFANSEALPKPLIQLDGKPFFWWAVESVRRLGPVDEMVFVVLDEHVRQFAIDQRIREYYPSARIERLAQVTAGAADTAAAGVASLRSVGPVAICDSDLAFDLGEGDVRLALADRDGLLLCFESHDPAYSFACVDAAGEVCATVEKRAVSDCAIAGCYLFASPQTYLDAQAAYRLECAYDEAFISGVYNTLIGTGGRVGRLMLRRHLSFGTPAEFASVTADPTRLDLWAA